MENLIEAMNDLFAGNIYLIISVICVSMCVCLIAIIDNLLEDKIALNMEIDRLAYNLKNASKRPVYRAKLKNGGEK